MVVSARFLAHLGFACLRHGCQFTVFMVSCQSEHIQIAACGPWVAGDVANSDGDEHQGALAVGKVAHDARAPPDLAVEPFDHVVLFFPPIFFLWGRWKTAVFAGRSRWWSDLWCNYGATRAAIWFGKVFASRNLVAGGG